MDRKRLTTVAIAFLGSAGMSPAASDTFKSDTHAAIDAQPAAPRTRPVNQLAVLTYNVKGLPWPIATGRAPALATIGDTLADLRMKGQAPDVVVLQEAFTVDARAVAARAGYRYVAFGPDSADRQPTATTGFTAPRSMMKGETAGFFLSSGLVLMSDYRITAVRKTAFPVNACSGYDCLANKGILAATLAVTGVDMPVEIVTTHLNSAKASGQPEPVSRVAYEQQLDALDEFVGEDRRGKRSVRIYAGDFNVGHSEARLSALVGYIRHRKTRIATAIGRDKYAAMCLDQPMTCRQSMAFAANVPLKHANDWQFYQASGDVRLNPIAREVMFGRNRAGKMLSDHFGLNVVYQFR